jgi:4-amino-4-deoxy-L-arabinose transferase-like glycosyltransferase
VLAQALGLDVLVPHIEVPEGLTSVASPASVNRDGQTAVLATYFAAGAIFEKRSRNWPLVGFAIGLGFLAKYAAMLWFVGLLLLLWRTRAPRRGALIALAIALVMTLPVLIWNAQHNWASFRHVARQTGAAPEPALRHWLEAALAKRPRPGAEAPS